MTATGAILRRRDFDYRESDGVRIAQVVGPRLGATKVTVDVVELRPGTSWSDAVTHESEQVAVIYEGFGNAHVDAETVPLSRAVAVHAPTGRSLRLSCDAGTLIAYVWRTRLTGAERRGRSPRIGSTLWNDETQLVGFRGTGHEPAAANTAVMNFCFWPATGSARLCLHCGIQQPGETFNVHVHEEADDAFMAFEGKGQLYLVDRWIDVEQGDMIYAPVGVPHGARNPHTGPGAQRFVTCGGPTPFDPMLYAAAGVSAEVR
ncbi:cupin domain-containing protein [Nonomuraea sp. NPDC050691]|uniref:cupin domain-containing protein n=1 Tax=Nonomuraea sp. NPDC050691 TaxID=3155661 RepID=UPI0033F91CAE